jgi:glycosyltransferase involved in cell wall biosynthesis
MAHGVPVIAFAQGPLQQLVADGKNGWLVRSGNLAAMAHRINFWEAQGDDVRRLMSDQARRAIAERFSPQTAMAEVLSVYASAGA